MARTFVSLRLMSDHLDPDAIAQSTGIRATKAWRRGDRRPRTAILEREHGLELSSGVDAAQDLSQHLEALAGLVRGHEATIRAFASQGNHVQLSCALYAEHVPAVSLTRHEVTWMSSLAASLDVDIFLVEP